MKISLDQYKKLITDKETEIRMILHRSEAARAIYRKSMKDALQGIDEVDLTYTRFKEFWAEASERVRAKGQLVREALKMFEDYDIQADEDEI